MDWSRFYTYDIETYPNVFTIGIVHMDTGTRWLFEISERGNQSAALAEFLTELMRTECRMIGYNNEGFDYPVIHEFWRIWCERGSVTAHDLYLKAQSIIDTPWNDRFRNTIWPRDRIIPQVDLFKIMHFDNFARSTSLKKLEMNMRSGSIEDLPYPPGIPLTVDQIPLLVSYMCTDISETCKFAREIAAQIEFRDGIEDMDATNFNDTKIGKEFFLSELEKTGVQCFDRSSGRKKPRQTPRLSGIKVSETLLDVPFITDDLKRMHQFFSAQIIPPDQTKGVFKNLHATVKDFTMHFGAGGIHGSVSKRTFRSSDTHDIVDVDVTSYYPSLAIVNRWFPKHLGDQFCDVYQELKTRRVSYAKGTPENAMLKLALNGVYGDSNNKYSAFYDPAYTMSITINGQLLLAWLTEAFLLQPGFEVIQVNTDGVTVRTAKTDRHQLDAICTEWQNRTGLELESVDYSVMAVRDVNNYISVTVDGGVKRKGAYEIDPDWHKDHSSLVVQKAVSSWLLDGTDPTEFVYNHSDPYDFMRHVKVRKSDKLVWGDETIQNTTRYHIALAGKPLVKCMSEDRRIGVDVGWDVQVCNRAVDFDWKNLNRRFYITEAEKLIAGLG